MSTAEPIQSAAYPDNPIDLWDFTSVTSDGPWMPGAPKPPELTGEEKKRREEQNEFRIKLCRDVQEQLSKDADRIISLFTEGDADDDGDTEEGEERWDEPERGGAKPAAKPKKKGKSGVFLDGGKRVGRFAGVLNCTYEGRRWTLRIHSRFDTDGRDNFLRYALGLANVPVSVLSAFETSAENGMLGILLPRLFLQKLETAYRLGPFRQYRTFAYNDVRVRGHIDIARHIRLNPVQNGRVAYSVREYSLDNPVNHLILAAYGVLRKNFPQEMAVLMRSEPALGDPIRYLEANLGAENISVAALQRLAIHAGDPITHPMLRCYEELREMAMRIIISRDRDPFADGEERVSGILIPMDRVWERVLESALQLGGQEKTPIILGDDGQGRRILKPDLLLPGAVFDAKYRAPWTWTYYAERGVSPGIWDGAGIRADVFQVLSYMYLLQRPIGGVIFPYPSDGEHEAKPFDAIGDLPGHQFWLMPFPIPVKSSGPEEFDAKMKKNGIALKTKIEEIAQKQDS